jgi:cyclopropane fatty-acyl-phospholipid synthase-like methyltransferase
MLEISRFIPGALESQTQYAEILKNIKHVFDRKAVLDLGCHTGASTNLILKEYNAKSVVGVDFSSTAIETAKLVFPDASFYCHDLSEYNDWKHLVDQSTVVVTMGNFYHLPDHFNQIKTMCQPHIEYLVIDSLCGPESSDPSMFWTFQSPNGYKFWKNTVVPKGTPNISWIMQACNIFGFKLNYIHKYYSHVNFATVKDHEANKRMIAGFYNSNLSNKKASLSIDQVWEWNDSQKTQLI